MSLPASTACCQRHAPVLFFNQAPLHQVMPALTVAVLLLQLCLIVCQCCVSVRAYTAQMSTSKADLPTSNNHECRKGSMLPKQQGEAMHGVVCQSRRRSARVDSGYESDHLSQASFSGVSINVRFDQTHRCRALCFWPSPTTGVFDRRREAVCRSCHQTPVRRT
jgi:hypothetical protein